MKIFNLFTNYSCNARCGFCFNPAEPSRAEWNGPTTKAVVASLLAAHRDGCCSVSFIGGEPTVRPDFVSLVVAARRAGYRDLRLVTNGVKLADAAYARSLADAGLTRVDVSIHARDAALHDRLLGLPGSYVKALAALANLRRLRVAVGLNVVVSRPNHRDLPGLVEHFVREKGVRDFSFFSLRYIGHLELAANVEDLRVSQAETAPFVRAALEVLRREGCLERACLGDFTPCVLPGYESLMTDWEAGCNPDVVGHPDGRAEASEAVCSDGKRPVAACARCVYRSRCLGVNEPYLKLFGEAEFEPVLAESAAPARAGRTLG